jgi:protein TonB
MATAVLPPINELVPQARRPDDAVVQATWSPSRGRQRQAVVGGIAALHVLALWGLLQMRGVRDAVANLAPVTVSVVSAEKPPPEPAPLVVPPPPRPQPPAMEVPIPTLPMVLAPAPSPAPSPITVEVAAPVMPPAPPAAPTAPAAAPVAVPVAGPRELPSSAVQVISAPAPEYPRASRREREQGVVQVRLFIDAAGLPRQVQVARSSGFPRLDEAALAAVRKWRFKPPLEEGRPVEGWFTTPLNFTLE